MKKIASFLIAVVILFACVACEKEPENIEALDRIQVTYSVKNSDSGEFIVEIQEVFSDIEPYKSLYSSEGLYIKMSKDAKIYDADGNEIKQQNLVPGDTLEIYYDGTLESNSPKTIKAYKIVKIL